MIPPKVTIEGLTELRNAMRQAAAGSQKGIQKRLKDVSTTVASAIAGNVPTLTGTAASTVRPRATSTGASIVAGGPRADYLPWLDFGGTTGRGHKPGDGGGSISRPFIKEGRYIYPTIIDLNDVITDAANEGIGDALTEAGW